MTSKILTVAGCRSIECLAADLEILAKNLRFAAAAQGEPSLFGGLVGDNSVTDVSLVASLLDGGNKSIASALARITSPDAETLGLVGDNEPSAELP